VDRSDEKGAETRREEGSKSQHKYTSERHERAGQRDEREKEREDEKNRRRDLDTEIQRRGLCGTTRVQSVWMRIEREAAEPRQDGRQTDSTKEEVKKREEGRRKKEEKKRKETTRELDIPR